MNGIEVTLQQWLTMLGFNKATDKFMNHRNQQIDFDSDLGHADKTKNKIKHVEWDFKRGKFTKATITMQDFRIYHVHFSTVKEEDGSE